MLRDMARALRVRMEDLVGYTATPRGHADIGPGGVTRIVGYRPRWRPGLGTLA